jgi:hypothetical protein
VALSAMEGELQRPVLEFGCRLREGGSRRGAQGAFIVKVLCPSANDRAAVVFPNQGDVETKIFRRACSAALGKVSGSF